MSTALFRMSLNETCTNQSILYLFLDLVTVIAFPTPCFSPYDLVRFTCNLPFYKDIFSFSFLSIILTDTKLCMMYCFNAALLINITLLV